MKRCFYCYQPVSGNESDFHAACSKKIFGVPIPPELLYTETDIEELGKEVVRSQFAVTGAQPKLSLDIIAGKGDATPARFTIVGLWGQYILKPPTPRYPQLPEVEDLTMHLAQIANMEVVPHSLIRFPSNRLAYITRRIDRQKKRKQVQKLHMEDMCQLTERLTEHKYDGSHEQIAKTILKFSARPVLDVLYFYEQVLFSFLTGNADMHLKNFSLIDIPDQGYILAPGYDMVSTALVMPEDIEELALNLNGRKSKIERKDFIAAFHGAKLDEKQQLSIFGKMEQAKEKWLRFIDISFIRPDFKTQYKAVIKDRFDRLEK